MSDPAVEAGMTEREAAAWWLVRDAASACLSLTDHEPHHGMEREEMCHAFHVIQGWLASRPTIRTMTRLSHVERLCVCGEPETDGVVHRFDGPCYDADVTP